MDDSNEPQDSAPIIPPPAHHGASPVVAFMIGLSIIILASILNAAGLNLTKLDHVRTHAIPKASRKKDWLRPLWLLGMILYILSQIIGSTLALEYMRAEYCAPLGSTSLIFNFLFARFLVGTTITSNDIYGTIIVVLGVVGIVGFGSINSGLSNETDIAHLTELWRRGGWLTYFFAMAAALILLIMFTAQLDAVLAARSDINSVPFSGMNAGAGSIQLTPPTGGAVKRFFYQVFHLYSTATNKIAAILEQWTAAKDDTSIAWTLGIMWSCCGGSLAGACLVFAKAVVKLTSGALSHENTGNQFGHAAAIFTILLLATTAISQIICLNRGLRVYDSTLVVPVFYGVYTASGFLNSLIFNDETDAYQTWTLFLLFVSMSILISGVVLLTHKKPEPGAKAASAANTLSMQRRSRTGRKASTSKIDVNDLANNNQDDDDDDDGREVGEDGALWGVGDASDDSDEGEDEDEEHPQNPLHKPASSTAAPERDTTGLGKEGVALLKTNDNSGSGSRQGHSRSSLDTTSDSDSDSDSDTDEFGAFAQAAEDKKKS